MIFRSAPGVMRAFFTFKPLCPVPEYVRFILRLRDRLPGAAQGIFYFKGKKGVSHV